MNNTTRTPSPLRRGFTLIELLVVISIIGILAALLIPGIGKVRQKMAIARVQAELVRVETAIKSYKSKLGFYPPGNANPLNPATNQLYFELSGCTFDGTTFTTRDQLTSITTVVLSSYFGSQIVVNHSRAGGADDGAMAQTFLKELKPGQYGEVVVGSSRVRLLGTVVDGPVMFGNSPASINPFRYNSTNPTNNPNSFDLWADVLVGGKTNRVNNWTKKPIVL